MTSIIVRIDDPLSPQSVLVELNTDNNLSNIREKLKSNDTIEMNDTLSFAKKIRINSLERFSKVAREDEKDYLLEEIIETTEGGNILYLTQDQFNWRYFNERYKLDYGCTISNYGGIKRADERAFIMRGCEITEIGAGGYKKGAIEFNSDQDLVVKSNLFSVSDINVRDFVKLGISVGKPQSEDETNSTSKGPKFKTNSTYHFIEIGKVSLKFGEYLPTEEFINAIENVIKSENPRENLKKIVENFGPFVPSEVILGGRAYFEGIRSLKESSGGKINKVDANLNIKVGIGINTNNSSENTSSLKLECFKIIGGEQPNSLENFDEFAWINSLGDFKNWDCIEFKNSINIFKLLPDDLRRRICSSVGKRILYSKFEDFSYTLKEHGSPTIFELRMPSDVSKIIQNKDTDCNIFATVIDKNETKDEIFNCQIFYPPTGRPSIIIHCIQKNFRKRNCHLQIHWMVIGYDIDFNSILSDLDVQITVLKNDINTKTMDNKVDFKRNSLTENIPYIGISVLNKLDSSNDSVTIGHHFFVNQGNVIGLYTFAYDLKSKHYVNLPNFTFYTLIISRYPNSNDYGVLPFNKKNNTKSKFKDLFKSGTSLEQVKPKYISLYTEENNCGPIFLKQNVGKVKKKYVGKIGCNEPNCICKKAFDEKHLKYAFFVPPE